MNTSYCRITFFLQMLVCFLGLSSVDAATLDLASAKLTINEQGIASLAFADGTQWPASKLPAFTIDIAGQKHSPKTVEIAGDLCTVRFDNNVTAQFRVTTGQGFVVFRLVKIEPREGIVYFDLFSLAAPAGVRVLGTINAGVKDGRFAALMAAEPNVGASWDGSEFHVGTMAKHGIEPAAFGIIACPEAQRFEAIARFEVAAGLPSPRLDGVWNKQSPRIKQSYFFLTDFRESQFDEALAIAKRGGFSTILLGQESWTVGTGHYQINRERYPEGLDGFKRTLQKFKDAGFRVGLHLLGASVYPPDTYLTPTPDPRLFKGVSAGLAADIDEKATTLPLDIAPKDFPAEDGGYEGTGTVLRIGDELINYGKRSLEAPFGFVQCQRGHLGTKVAAHKKGDRVFHLERAYGYHLHDMDTTLTDEIAGHFAAVANACGIDMIYFDGSEWLQGKNAGSEHWYYNSRLIKAFYDKLQNKNTLIQASSFSHYSWHILARTASADGHGDLKGYLNERSGWFEPCTRDVMPLDIGWYYGYDPNSTPDQYEYILGATIGYDSSMSFQVSCAAAANHPFTGEILDLIARYEKLRLSGRVPQDMRKRFHIDPILAGKKPEQQGPLLDRYKEYRLLGPAGHEVFQRVVYSPWHEMKPAEAQNATWKVRISDPQTRVGVQIHARSEAGGDKTLVDPFVEIDGQRWQWKGELRAGQYVFFWPDEPIARYGLPLKQPERLTTNAAAGKLPVGEHTVRFGCQGTAQTPVRVRVTLQPPERHAIP